MPLYLVVSKRTGDEMTSYRIIRRRELEGLIGLGRSSIYAMMSEGRFPKPIKLGKRAVGWREADIKEWLAARPIAGSLLRLWQILTSKRGA